MRVANQRFGVVNSVGESGTHTTLGHANPDEVIFWVEGVG